MLTWVLQNSLWLIGFGLMLASSGLDGAYLFKLMPAGYGWLGLVLNTTADIASEIISFWFGRLQQDQSQRKRKLSRLLWIAEFVLVGYAWLFGWRQLLPILRSLESQDAGWLAPLMAGFTPMALVAVGYTQALLSGKIEQAQKTQSQPQTSVVLPQIVEPEPQPAQLLTANIETWRAICANLDGEKARLSTTRVNELLAERGYAPKAESTARYWARVARDANGPN